LNNNDGDQFATPIVGSVKNQTDSTSGDVHLYPDPKTFVLPTPILYADCEGLEGGGRDPISSKFKKNAMFSRIGRASSFKKTARKTQHTSEREIQWVTTAQKRSREYAVTNLYPRLLYTFSDVVFVLKNQGEVQATVFQYFL
jgi:hypothetical protein